MGKSRFIALIMVVAIMLMGAGYAQWTDLLTVEADICTGDMNVEFTDGELWVWCGEDILEANLTTTDVKKQTIEIGNMYPGAWVEYMGTLENLGTIPAEIENVAITTSGTACDCELLYEALGWRMRLKINGEAIVPGPLTTGTGLGNLEDELMTQLHERALDIGDDLVFQLILSLPCDIINEDELENRCCEIDIEFNFGQVAQWCRNIGEWVECPEDSEYSENTY